jgi:CBS domain-containing protein
MISEQFALIDAIEQMCAYKKVDFRAIRTAGDIMTADVKTLTMDHTVKAFLDFMDTYRVRHAPVVDFHDGDRRKPYFVGVISQRDVLRLNSPQVGQIGGQAIDPKALRQLLAQITTRNIRCASPHTPIPEVITTMIDNHIDMVPVIMVDNRSDMVPIRPDVALAGIITTTDIIKLYTRLEKAIHPLYPELKHATKSTGPVSVDSPEAAALFSWICRTVSDVMTKDIIWLEPEDQLGVAMETMKESKFRHLPVVDEHGKMIGIVSDRDIMRHLPFAGKRPPLEPKGFRAHLFKVDTKGANLKQTVDQIMTRKIKHVLPECSVCEAAKILRKSKIGCLPVTNKRKKLHGMVTVIDLMRSLLEVYKPIEDSQP